MESTAAHPDYLTRAQVAEIFGVSEATVGRMVDAGALKQRVFGPRSKRIHRSWVEAMKAEDMYSKTVAGVREVRRRMKGQLHPTDHFKEGSGAHGH
jgi:excisionase family DNA binding protein